jgi:glycerol-3-phosphate dehydrogenase
MWTKGWREAIWSQIEQPWDVIIIGGGMTGAGVFREAVNAGMHALLVEANDFSYGTSSRSSKLIHGGFRYMRNRQFDVTRESVREREWMLKEAKNLVTPLSFLFPNYDSYHTPNWEFGLGVFLYDLFGSKWQHRTFSLEQVKKIEPNLNCDGFLKGFQYYDAQVDDSRLVLRILQEAVHAGGFALNFARVENLLKTTDGKVCGVLLHDTCDKNGAVVEVRAGLVINASGPWSDEIRQKIKAPKRLRKLRGSHLVFSRQKLPLKQAYTLMHPKDHRAMFAIPWEGTSIIGTTDLDHQLENDDLYASQEEIEYMLHAVHATFPSLKLRQEDILSTFSGIRPVIQSGDGFSPSHASRRHAVWDENGMLTITGGKITTFHIMVDEVLQKAARYLPGKPSFPTGKRMFADLPEIEASNLHPAESLYLLGRYGGDANELIKSAQPGELEHISDTPNFWAELRWAARSEAVLHLDDLLMRRVRLGLVTPNGAESLLPKIRSIVQPELGWEDDRWQLEEQEYRKIWLRYYSPTPGN